MANIKKIENGKQDFYYDGGKIIEVMTTMKGKDSGENVDEY